MRNLHKDTGAIASQRIRADGTAVLQVFQDVQRTLHDFVRLAALHIGNEADAAGIKLPVRIEQTLGFWASNLTLNNTKIDRLAVPRHFPTLCRWPKAKLHINQSSTKTAGDFGGNVSCRSIKTCSPVRWTNRT